MFWLQRNSRKLRAPAIHRPTDPGRYPSSCKCFFRRNSHSWWFESDSDMCASSGRLRIAPSRYGELNMRLKLALLPRKDFLLITGSLRLPGRLHMDNGKEFHAQALERGCREYGIDVEYRPPLRPTYGAHIERLIGTMMGEVHLLPGTTSSSVADRGDYDSAGCATMTLKEFEI